VIVDKAHDNEAGIAEVAAVIEGPLAAKYGIKGKIHAKPPKDFVAQNRQFKLVTGMAWAFSFVALIIGGIGVLNTMIMSVFERTREIGILRAIGWRPSRIMKMILMESALLSFGGGVLGTVGGIGMILVASRFASVSGIVHASISTDIVVKGFIVAMVVGLFGAAWPAYRGSRLLPTEALRHE
jgi:putative ABC transport system permease protein